MKYAFLQRGSWWEWGGILSGTGTQKHIRKVTSDSRTVTTPHGTFHNCIEITFSTELTRGGKSRRLESKEIYAPAFGLVKVEYLEQAVEPLVYQGPRTIAYAQRWQR